MRAQVIKLDPIQILYTIEKDDLEYGCLLKQILEQKTVPSFKIEIVKEK